MTGLEKCFPSFYERPKSLELLIKEDWKKNLHCKKVTTRIAA